MALIVLENHDELRIGHYVKLEASWWKHPFTKSSFKISSQKELDTIRAVKKIKILYDPGLSDPPPEETPDDDAPTLIDSGQEQEDIAPPQEEEQTTDEVELPAELKEEPKVKEEPEVKEDQRRLLHEYREQFQKVEKAYWKTLGESKDIFKGVSEGRGRGLKQAGEMVSHLGEVLEDPNSTMSLMDVVSSHGMSKGISHHALNVCILSMITGRTLDLSKDQLNALALAALFHDIGQRLLPVKVKFQGSGIVTQVDPETMPLHPAQAKELLQTLTNFPKESIEAIYQHHERLDGSGYPLGLKNEQISLLAKIIMVIDQYDDLCNANNPQLSLTPHEALSRLFKTNQDKETCKFSIDVILAMIQSLSLFPPGTIVELNDGTFGIVTSINMSTPTKPLIFLYIGDATKHDIVLVDLAEEKTLSITKSIRPKDLPPKVLEHLSPQRMSIFIHANQKTSTYSDLSQI